MAGGWAHLQLPSFPPQAELLEGRMGWAGIRPPASCPLMKDGSARCIRPPASSSHLPLSRYFGWSSRLLDGHEAAPAVLKKPGYGGRKLHRTFVQHGSRTPKSTRKREYPFWRFICSHRDQAIFCPPTKGIAGSFNCTQLREHDHPHPEGPSSAKV